MTEKCTAISTPSKDEKKFAGPPSQLDKTKPPIFREIIQYSYFLKNTHRHLTTFAISQLIAKDVIDIWKTVKPCLPVLKKRVIDNRVNVVCFRKAKQINRKTLTVKKRSVLEAKLDALFDISTCSCNLPVLSCDDPDVKCNKENCQTKHIICTCPLKVPVEEREFLKDGRAKLELKRKKAKKKSKKKKKRLDQQKNLDSSPIASTSNLPDDVSSHTQLPSSCEQTEDLKPESHPKEPHSLNKIPRLSTITHQMQMLVPTHAETQVQNHFPPAPVQIQKPVRRKKQVFKVANHQCNIMSNLASFWRNGKFCDASIGNGKATVKVHKLVLYAACPKLLSLSKSDIESHEFLQVKLPEKVSWEALNAFAVYMYNGILDLDCKILEQLKIIADRLDMKEFEELCDRHLHNYIHQPTTHAVAIDIPLNHPSMQFPSMTSSLPSLSSTISAPIQSAPSITTQVIDVKQEISESDLVRVSKHTAAVSSQESEVASLTPNKSGNADGFVICPSVKTEPVGLEDDKYGHLSSNSNNQTFALTVPSSSSSSSTAPSISITLVPASQTEFAITFSETTDVKSTKLKDSRSYESTLVSDTSPVSFIVEKICSQSSHMTETISKPLSLLSNPSSVDLPTTSDKSVYPVRLYKSEANNLPP